MIDHSLSCFSNFHCLAGRCPSTCCAGWEVDLDEQILSYYRRLSGPLGEEIRSHIQTADGYTFFTLQEGRCPFLNSDNLCRLILSLGDNALSVTCREHPRFVEEYGTLRETCLSISCPEAARLLLKGPVALVCRETAEASEEDWSLDQGYLQELLEYRQILFHATQVQRPLAERLSFLIVSANEIGTYKDSGTFSDGDRIETTVCRTETPVALSEHLQQVPAPALELDLPGFFRTMEQMEFTSDQLPTLLKSISTCLDSNLLQDNSESGTHLLLYFLYRYVLRAVWDGQVREKVLFAVYATAAILCLSQSMPDPDPLRQAAVLFSREVEHSDENLDLLYAFLNGTS